MFMYRRTDSGQASKALEVKYFKQHLAIHKKKERLLDDQMPHLVKALDMKPEDMSSVPFPRIHTVKGESHSLLIVTRHLLSHTDELTK